MDAGWWISAASMFEDASGCGRVSYDDRPFVVELDVVCTVQIQLWKAILDRLPNLRLDPDAPVPVVQGYAFRSPDALPVLFDATS